MPLAPAGLWVSALHRAQEDRSIAWLLLSGAQHWDRVLQAVGSSRVMRPAPVPFGVAGVEGRGSWAFPSGHEMREMPHVCLG